MKLLKNGLILGVFEMTTATLQDPNKLGLVFKMMNSCATWNTTYAASI